jgi:hypothetical protein
MRYYCIIATIGQVLKLPMPWPHAATFLPFSPLARGAKPLHRGMPHVRDNCVLNNNIWLQKSFPHGRELLGMGLTVDASSPTQHWPWCVALNTTGTSEQLQNLMTYNPYRTFPASAASHLSIPTHPLPLTPPPGLSRIPRAAMLNVESLARHRFCID